MHAFFLSWILDMPYGSDHGLTILKAMNMKRIINLFSFFCINLA